MADGGVDVDVPPPPPAGEPRRPRRGPPRYTASTSEDVAPGVGGDAGVPPPPPVAFQAPRRPRGRPRYAAATAEDDGGAADAAPLPPEPLKQRPPAQGAAGQAQWLGLVVVETTALLVLQVVVGVSTGSLALLADLGHGGADVISYAVNLAVELGKSSGDPARLRRLDVAGCCVSTALLCGSTVFALGEAVERLTAGEERVDPPGDSANVGAGILAFALASTVANISVFLAFRLRPWPLAPSRPHRLPVAQTDAQADAKGKRAPKRARPGKSGGLNLCDDFGGGDGGRCKDSCCQEGGAWSWSAVLHGIVHPGCTGHDGDSSGKDQGGGRSQLNLVSAMLHLLADVLRGLAMLVTAVLIQGHLVEDVGRADAICALLVAAFVALGSAALLHRVCTACSGGCRRGDVGEWSAHLSAPGAQDDVEEP